MRRRVPDDAGGAWRAWRACSTVKARGAQRYADIPPWGRLQIDAFGIQCAPKGQGSRHARAGSTSSTPWRLLIHYVPPTRANGGCRQRAPPSSAEFTGDRRSSKAALRCVGGKLRPAEVCLACTLRAVAPGRLHRAPAVPEPSRSSADAESPCDKPPLPPQFSLGKLHVFGLLAAPKPPLGVANYDN